MIYWLIIIQRPIFYTINDPKTQKQEYAVGFSEVDKNLMF